MAQIRQNSLHTSLLTTTAFTAAAIASLAVSKPAYAGANDVWTNGTITHGTATIDNTQAASGLLNINQSSARARGLFDSLSIGKNATVNVNQSSGASSIFVADTRADVDPSRIQGNLNCDATCVLLDPNGVIFGKESSINAGSIIASTGQIADLDAFMTGANTKMILENINVIAGSRVVLKGEINVADGGLVALVAPTVATLQASKIIAKMGKVELVSGDKVTIDLYGDSLVEIAADGEIADALVRHSGQIEADGGLVGLTAAQAKGLVDKVINMTGFIQANTVGIENGEIVLNGGNNGRVRVAGTMLSAGINAGENGGTISITGEHTNFRGLAVASAQGPQGGSVHISGTESLNYEGIVSTASTTGTTGTLTLDPPNLYLWDGIGPGPGMPAVSAFFLARTLSLSNVHLVAGDNITLLDDIDVSRFGLSLTPNDLTFKTDVLNLDHDLMMGTGHLFFDVNTANLNGQALNHDGTALDRTRLGGTASIVNVLSDRARIQQGIDVAASGATVNVSVGAYAENLDIYKSLTLDAGKYNDADGTPVLMGTDPSGQVILVSANDVTIKGFNVKASVLGGDDSLYGLYAKSVERLNITHNAFTGFDGAGVKIDGVSNARSQDINIAYNTFTYNNVGAMLSEVDRSTINYNFFLGTPYTDVPLSNTGLDVFQGLLTNIHNNVFLYSETGVKMRNVVFGDVFDNTFGKSVFGIASSDGSVLRLNDNRFYYQDTAINVDDEANFVWIDGNTMENIKNGVAATNVNNLFITNNQMYGNTTIGIDVTASPNALIQGNVIDNFDIGIRSTGSGGVVIDDNTVTNSTTDGIQVNSSFDNTVTQNTVEDSGRNGIAFDSTGNNLIARNRVRFSGDNALQITRSSFNTIRFNRLGFSGRNGVAISGGFTHAIHHNGIRFTGKHGVELLGTAAARALNNFMSKIGEDGFNVGNFSLLTTIKGNAIHDAGDDAVDVHRSSRSRIKNNYIKNTGDNGIEIHDSFTTLIARNSIYGASGDGIEIYRSHHALAAHNNIHDAEDDGIDVRYSDGVGILKNKVAAQYGERIGDNGLQISGNTDVFAYGNKIGNGLGVSGGNGSDFSIGNDGISVNGSSYVGVVRNSITGVYRDGVHVGYSDHVKVKGNTIFGPDGTPIFTILSTQAFVNQPDDHERGAGVIGRDGVNVHDSYQVGVFNNKIGAANGGFGGPLSITDDPYNDDPYGSGFAINRDGIHIEYSQNILADGNDINSVGRDAVHVFDSYIIDITNNNIGASFGDGGPVMLYDKYEDPIEPVDANANIGRDGVYIAFSDDVEVIGNNIDGLSNNTSLPGTSQNGHAGIFRDGVHVEYSGGLLSPDNLDQSALLLTASAYDMPDQGPFTPGIRINDNRITHTQDDNVDVMGSTNVQINNNSISLAYDNGIELTNDSFVTADDNLIENNTNTGIQIGGSDEVILSNNQINNNSIGIHVLPGEDFVFDTLQSDEISFYLSGFGPSGSIILQDNVLNDNPVGAWFESGQITLAGTNTFNNGDVAMRFSGGNVKIVGDTLGMTEFFGQSTFYVELTDTALFDPGMPTIIDGTMANFNGFIPGGGPIPSLILQDIESMLNDFDDDDTLGQIFVGDEFLIDQSDLDSPENTIPPTIDNISVTILRLPFLPGEPTANALNQIAPAAGPDFSNLTPEQLAQLEPAAGGDTTNRAECWAKVASSLDAGAFGITYSFDSNPSNLNASTATCPEQTP